MKPIDSDGFHQSVQGLPAPHGVSPVKAVLSLGGLLIVAGTLVASGGLFAGCGNAQMSWARLISNLENNNSVPSSSQQQPVSTMTQRKVQTGFGQGIASASGVTARVWIKTGTSQGGFQGAGGGVVLKNVTLK